MSPELGSRDKIKDLERKKTVAFNVSAAGSVAGAGSLILAASKAGDERALVSAGILSVVTALGGLVRGIIHDGNIILTEREENLENFRQRAKQLVMAIPEETFDNLWVQLSKVRETQKELGIKNFEFIYEAFEQRVQDKMGGAST